LGHEQLTQLMLYLLVVGYVIENSGDLEFPITGNANGCPQGQFALVQLLTGVLAYIPQV